MILPGWTEFALVVFVASHFPPRVGGPRKTLIGRIGRRPYFAGYRIVLLLAPFWQVGSASRTHFIELWAASDWTRMVPVVVMHFAMFLAVIDVETRWPFTLGSKEAKAFDPANPGLTALTRHPLLWALALWAVPVFSDGSICAGSSGTIQIAASPTLVSRSVGPWPSPVSAEAVRFC